MKKIFFFAALCLVNVALTAQDNKPSALPNTLLAPSDNSKLIIHNSRILIVHQGKTYTLMGQKLGE